MSADRIISRRDMLKLTGAAFASALLPFKSAEAGSKFIPAFEYVGPYINNSWTGGSDGERSGFIDPNNADKMIVGTFGEGVLQTVDGGKNWSKVNVPVIQREYSPSEPRDIVSIPGTNDILIAMDSNLVRGSFDNPNWSLIKLPSENWIAQTLCALPDGRILIGGTGYPFTSGLAVADSKNFNWKMITGLYSAENEFYIRSIKHFSGKIFFGGWFGITNDGSRGGTGMFCVDDKNFQPIKEYEHAFTDDRGAMSVNMIEATVHNGREIIFVGGEGTGTKNNRRFNPSRPSLRILLDGNEITQSIVNSKGVSATGGWDLISPQRGIVISEGTGEVFVSSGFKEISRASLNDVLYGAQINWQRITKPPAGQVDTGALHIRLSHRKNSGTPALMMCREIYGNGSLPFQQVGIANLTY